MPSVVVIADSDTNAKQQTPISVYLIRYVARQLYAPQRLRNPDSQLRFLATDIFLESCPLVQGVDWRYELLGEWRGYGHSVAAVLVRNESDLRIPLDPRLFMHRRIRGDWLATSFHHRWLEAKGSSAHSDTTVLYLVGCCGFTAHKNCAEVDVEQS